MSRSKKILSEPSESVNVSTTGKRACFSMSITCMLSQGFRHMFITGYFLNEHCFLMQWNLRPALITRVWLQGWRFTPCAQVTWRLSLSPCWLVCWEECASCLWLSSCRWWQHAIWVRGDSAGAEREDMVKKISNTQFLVVQTPSGVSEFMLCYETSTVHFLTFESFFL